MEEDTNPAETSKTRSLSKPYKITLCALIVFMGALIISLVCYTRDSGLIAKGVVLEIPLGQLTIKEAQSKLEQIKDGIYQRPVQFISNEKSISISLKDLGLTYNYQEPLQQAYLIGRRGSIFTKAITKFKASWGITYKPDCQWDNQILVEALRTHLAYLNIPAKDAHFTINSDSSLKIVPEEPGKQVDLDSLITSIKKESINDTMTLPVPFKTIKPVLSRSDLEKVMMYGLLSDYRTNFDANLIERTHNIKLAAAAIDGNLLKPGEVFSFNGTVGPRTIEAGYREAIIIEGNQFVPGLGGGVCQVSSTLYNAVLRASPSLSVVERSRHSLPVSYVPPDHDATVAYPNLDFKFRNETSDYILIRSRIDQNTLNFSLYGKK